MRNDFYGKTWIYWAQLIGFGALGLFSVILGPLFWTGIVADAKGEPRPQAGPPLVLIGTSFLAIAALAIFNINARIAPVIRCYRNGIECQLIGVSSLDGVPYVPPIIRIAWTILSLQGFRSHSVRILWPQFSSAQVSGIPMAYVLTLHGTVIDVKTGHITNWLAFNQAALKDSPHEIADTLNRLAAEPVRREQLLERPTDLSIGIDR